MRNLLITVGVVVAVVSIVMAIIGINNSHPGIGTGKQRGQVEKQELIIIYINDLSISTKPIRELIGPCLIQIFATIDPDSHLVLCRMVDDTRVILEKKGLPTPEQLSASGVKDWLQLSKKHGTKPLTAIELANCYAKDFPKSKIVVVIFTDGENDFPQDESKIIASARELVERPNVIQIGLLGVVNDSEKGGRDWHRFWTKCLRYKDGRVASDKVMIRGPLFIKDSIDEFVQRTAANLR